MNYSCLSNFSEAWVQGWQLNSARLEEHGQHVSIFEHQDSIGTAWMAFARQHAEKISGRNETVLLSRGRRTFHLSGTQAHSLLNALWAGLAKGTYLSIGCHCRGGCLGEKAQTRDLGDILNNNLPHQHPCPLKLLPH